MGSVLGIDLGGTRIKAGLVRDSEVIAFDSEDTDAPSGKDAVVQNIIRLCRRVLQTANTASGDIDGLCIAVPAPLNADRTALVAPPNLACLDGVRLAELVAREFGCHGVLENDANAAALGEKFYGAAKGVDDFIVLTLGTGLGGGLVSGGRVLRGRGNLAGEIGHIVVRPEGGRLCGCGGVGCAEGYVSIGGLLKSAREACAHLLVDGELSVDGEPLNELNGPTILARLALEGDDRVKRVFHEMGLCLGVVIANVVKLFGTELVVLSGGISNGFTLFEAGVWETVRKYTGFKALLDPLRIEVSRIKENSAVLGAAAALIDTIAPATKLLLATSSSSNRKFEQFTLPISDSPVAETVLAVQIGSTRTRAALIKNGELDGGVVLRDRKADRSEREFHQIMNDVAEVAAQASAGREGDVAAVVLIVPCGINRQKGRFFAAPGVPELGGHALGDTFQSFGVPVFLENDANAALLFDYHYGNANDVANVLSLHLVYGIGGAVIVDGRLLHGRHGHATEFGHVSLDCLSDNRLCACRQVGCLELFASGRALEEQAASAGGDAIPVFDGNYMDIVHAAKHNHPTATQLMDGFAEHLAKGMVGIFTLFDPSLVLFTGALSQARPYFEEKIKTALSDRAFWEYGADATFRTTADPMTGELRAASVIAGGLAVNSTLR